LEKAAAARRSRAALKDKLKHGGISLAEVLEAGQTDEAVGKMRVSAVIEALPGIGKVRAERLMHELKISDGRRVRGLGGNQRRALLEALGSPRSDR
jgi:Holliday junction resolvasome RuvABC DNA-binding subunit